MKTKFNYRKNKKNKKTRKTRKNQKGSGPGQSKSYVEEEEKNLPLHNPRDMTINPPFPYQDINKGNDSDNNTNDFIIGFGEKYEQYNNGEIYPIINIQQAQDLKSYLNKYIPLGIDNDDYIVIQYLLPIERLSQELSQINFPVYTVVSYSQIMNNNNKVKGVNMIQQKISELKLNHNQTQLKKDYIDGNKVITINLKLEKDTIVTINKLLPPEIVDIIDKFL